ACGGGTGGLGQPCPRRVVPPQQHGVSILQIWNTNTAPKCQRMGIVLVPTTDLYRIDQVRTAKQPYESLYPVEAVHHRRPTGGGNSKCNTFRALALTRSGKPRCDLIQRLRPADFAPTRVGGVAVSCPFQRPQ